MLEQDLKPQGYSFERLEQLYAEREEEYRKREETFTGRQEILRSREQAVKEKETQLKQELEELERKRADLEALEAELKKQGKELEEAREGLEEEKGRSLLEVNVMRGETRNMELRAQRLCEEYEAKLALLDGDVAELLKNPVLPEKGDFISREEHDRAIGELASEYERLQSENQELTKEKAELIRKLLYSRKEADKAKETDTVKETDEREADVPDPGVQTPPPVSVPPGDILFPDTAPVLEANADVYVMTDVKVMPGAGIPSEPGADTGIPPESGTDAGMPSGPGTEAEEELTAEVLCRYLDKQMPQGTAEVRHASDTDQVHMQMQGLRYVFVFGKPCYFDIAAKRKNSRELTGGRFKKGLLDTYNERFPGVTFRYQEETQEVVATGYFTDSMRPEELLAQIGTIADCFAQKEG